MATETQLKYLIEIAKSGDGAVTSAKELETLGASAVRADDQIQKLTGNIRNALVALAGAAVVKQSVDEFVRYENAVARLNGTLRAGGQFTGEYSNKLKEMASTLADEVRIFTDDQIIGVQSVLAGFQATAEEMPRLTRIVADMSASNRDLEGSALLVGAALGGNYSLALRNLKNVELPETATRAEKLEIVLNALETRSKGLASEMGRSAGGEIAQFKSAMSDAEKELGKLLFGLQAPALRAFTAILREITEQLRTSPALVIALTEAITALGLAASSASVAFALMKANAAMDWMFGAGAIKSAKDLAAALALLGARVVPIAAIATTLVTVYEQLRLVGDEENELRAGAAALGVRRELLRALRAEIDERVRLKNLTDDEAEDMRARLTEDGPWKDVKSVAAELRPSAPAQTPPVTDEQRRRDLETAKREMDELGRLQDLARARNDVRGQIGFTSPLGNTVSATRVSPTDLLRAQSDEQLVLLEKQRQQDLISESDYFAAKRQINQKFNLDRAELAKAGVEAEQEVGARRMDQYDLEQVRVSQHFGDLKEAIAGRYDYELARAEELGQATEEIEARKQAAMERVAAAQKQAMYEAGFLGSTLVKVGHDGAQAFSGGLASAIVQVASGSKSAKEAFSQFAASFMQQIAQMIMQALILRMVQGIFSAMATPNVTGPGTLQGGFTAVNTGVQAVANGGILPRKMASGGLQTVSSATYFPQFNAIAGEAGAEVLAVLSRPRMMDMGGLSTYVGKVQGQDMALTDARQLESAVSTRNAAPAAGRIEISVNLSPDLEARVMNNSVEQAVVRINTELATDSPTSAAVKSLTA